MDCLCCGAPRLSSSPVLWKELIDEWRISPFEVEYVNRQQGDHCTDCWSNLRTMALAKALMKCWRFNGLLKDFVREPAIQSLRILEINRAGSLTKFLQEVPGHVVKEYPDIDMMRLPFDGMSFDLVIHSDTLEHVEHPIRGLSECLRVLKPGGYCTFTVPIIVDRLTTSRAGMPPSYHGNPNNPEDCMVHTEYGADAWKHVIQAGFSECRLVALRYPDAHALTGVRDAA